MRVNEKEGDLPKCDIKVLIIVIVADKITNWHECYHGRQNHRLPWGEIAAQPPAV